MSDDWVVDSLVGFLQSPVWSSPVDDFIEQNCVVFDPGEEHKFAYSEIHNDFHALVEKLLDNFTTALGIAADQLAQACVQSSSLRGAHEKQLEQVLAAEDFVRFKSIMVQKNIDLELQALSLLKQHLGRAPEVYDPNSEPINKTVAGSYEEDAAFQEALKLSRREFEKQKSLDEEEIERLISRATQESLRLFEALEKEKQSQIRRSLQPPSEISLVGESNTTDKPVSLPLPKPSSASLQDPGGGTSRPPLTNKYSQSSQKVSPLQPLVSKHDPEGLAKMSRSEAASQWLQSARTEFGDLSEGLTTEKRKIGVEIPTDLKSREAYLKRQRDHLLSSKQKARAKELDKYNDTRKAVPTKTKLVTTPPITKPSGTNATPGKDEEATNVRDNRSTHEPKKKTFNTGVLCSVIARKLKE